MNFIHQSKSSIKDIIGFITRNIKEKEEAMVNFEQRYLSTGDDIIVINRFSLIELLDEFKGMINQSLQAIEILQTEMLNIEEERIKHSIAPKPNLIENNNKDSHCMKDNVIYQRPKGIKPTFTIKSNANQIKLTDNKEAYNGNYNQPIKSTQSIEEDHKKQEILRKEPMIIESVALYCEPEPEPNQEIIRTPLIHPGIIITKNLFRQSDFNTNENYNTIEMISTESDYTAIPSRPNVLQAKVNQINKDNKMKEIIMRIATIERYKQYLATKYANGNYAVFIEKLNNNKISSEDLDLEVKLISKEIRNDINKYKTKSRRSSSKPRGDNTATNTACKSTGSNKRAKTRLRSESTKRQIKQLNEEILQTYRQIDEL